MKVVIRKLVWLLIRWSGVLWVWRFRHRKRVTILMLHGVMDTEQPTSWVPLRPQLSRQALEKGLRRLSQYYRFVSLEDAQAMLTGRIPVQPYSLVLTFDDGYRNNLTHALPILRYYNAPAAVFVATGHVEKRKPFWFDRLDYVLQHAQQVEGRQVRIGQSTISLQTRDRASLRTSYKQLRDAAKALDRPDYEMVQEMEGLAANLEMECGRKLVDIFADDDWSAVLTWPELQRTPGNDLLIGSHTVDHIRLGLVETKVAKDQLVRSKAVIENQTGKTCRYFCYPNGSLNEAVVALVRECGYDAAVTTDEGLNTPGQDLMTLRRLPFPETGDSVMTLAHASGLTSAIARWREQLQGLRVGKRRAKLEASVAHGSAEV